MDATRQPRRGSPGELRRWAKTGLVLVYGQNPSRRRTRHGPRFDLGVLAAFLFFGLGYAITNLWPS